MPPKKSSASPTASAVQHKPPDGISTQLWELSKSTASLVKKLSAQETEEDHHQGCSKAEACSIIHICGCFFSENNCTIYAIPYEDRTAVSGICLSRWHDFCGKKQHKRQALVSSGAKRRLIMGDWKQLCRGSNVVMQPSWSHVQVAA